MILSIAKKARQVVTCRDIIDMKFLNIRITYTTRYLPHQFLTCYHLPQTFLLPFFINGLWGIELEKTR